MVTRNISPPSLNRLLSIAQQFDDGVFDALESLLKNKETIEPSDEELEAIGQEFGEDIHNLRYFVAFVTYLYMQLEGLDEDDLVTTLDELLSQNDIQDEDNRLKTKLISLLGYRNQHEKISKLDRLTKGFIPFLIGTSSFVDLRADFERDENAALTGKIVSYVTVAQLALLTDSTIESERQFVVQMDRSATKQLLKTLEGVLEKMAIVESKQPT